MNTDCAFVEFTRLPKGTYRTQVDDTQIDVWQVSHLKLGQGFQYTYFDMVTNCFTGWGFVKCELDEALESVVDDLYPSNRKGNRQ